MANEWEVAPLAGLIDADRGISYGIVQPGHAVIDGVPIVRVTNLRDGRIATQDPLKVAPAIEAAYARTRLRGGELLLTLVGTVGEAAVVPDALAGWNTARAVAVIPVREEIGAYWVKLALRTPAVQHIISSRLNTTVQATLNLRDVAQLPIALPPRREREAIAHILGTLDDKIELNRRMNETLEGTARAIFKDWFVDFGPTRAKMEGHEPYLPADLWSLFPDGFGENGSPQGWTFKPFSDVFEIRGGNTPSTENSAFWEGPHQWATPKDLSALKSPVLLQTARQLTDAGLQRCSSRLLPVGSLLLSTRAPIGYLAFVTKPTAINQGFAGIVKRHVSTTYAWGWCAANMGSIAGNAGGSTFPEISKSVLRRILMLAPAQQLLDAFANITEELVGRITASAQKSQTLAALRDLLLPKLISGDIRVPVATEIAEAGLHPAS